MTFSLVAVFIPVLFMSGIVGRLLHEFSVTIVVAILISGFVSLTLTPMLGSRFLKHDHRARHGLAYRALEGGFNTMQRWYEVTLGIAMRFRLVTLSIAILMLVGTVYLFTTMPTGFIPSQDSGFMFAGTLGPQDASFDWVAAHNHAAGEIVRAHPDVQDVGVFVVRREPGVHVRAHEAARGQDPFGGPDHRTAAPRHGRHPRPDGLHAESAADHGQRPEFRQRVPAHVAEREPQGDL